MPTKHEQRAKIIAELVEKLKRSQQVRKAAIELRRVEVEEGEEI